MSSFIGRLLGTQEKVSLLQMGELAAMRGSAEWKPEEEELGERKASNTKSKHPTLKYPPLQLQNLSTQHSGRVG